MSLIFVGMRVFSSLGVAFPRGPKRLAVVVVSAVVHCCCALETQASQPMQFPPSNPKFQVHQMHDHEMNEVHQVAMHELL